MKKNYNLHILALIIISTYYLSSLLIFNGVVISPHDNLDITAVNDHIIGKIINGDFTAAGNFLSGEITSPNKKSPNKEAPNKILTRAEKDGEPEPVSNFKWGAGVVMYSFDLNSEIDQNEREK